MVEHRQVSAVSTLAFAVLVSHQLQGTKFGFGACEISGTGLRNVQGYRET